MYNIDAFDATKPQVFTFESIGGDQVVANQLTIIKQSTAEVVYQYKQITNTFLHNLPADTLENGLYYSAYIVTYNADDEESSQSVAIQFRCYETPSWEFTNIPESGIINNANYIFNVRYSQPQYERLSQVTFNFYDDTKVLIDTDTKFVGMPHLVDHFDVEYQIDGLSNTIEYYIQAKGVTEHGMQLDTGLIYFKAEYEVPPSYNVIGLTDNCEKGYVSVEGRIVTIQGESSPEDLTYVKNNTAVLQDSDGNYITWDENLSLPENYRVILWGRSFYLQPTANQFQLHITDDSGYEIITVIDDLGNNIYRLKGTIYDEDGQEINTIYSNNLTVPNMFLLQQLIVKKEKGVYTLQYRLVQEYTTTAILGRAVIGAMIIGQDTI